MTLPHSGPLSLADIKGEFGGPASPSLHDYYAGGTYVPSGTTGDSGAIPSSGQISIHQFYGASNFSPHVDTFNSGQSGSNPIPAGATQLVLELYGKGGDGGHGATGSNDHQGGGGAGGGYVKSIFALSSSDWGHLINYDVDTGGVNTSVSGWTTANAARGGNGNDAGPSSNGAGSTLGGAATGGNNTNTNGGNGFGGNNFGTAGGGGSPNAGNGGFGNVDTGHTNGSAAIIYMRWT